VRAAVRRRGGVAPRTDALREGFTRGREKAAKRAYDVRTRTERLHVRLDPVERDALDFLALKWDATRSDVVRSMIVGAALAQVDRLDEALEAAEPSFDDVLPFPGLEVT
jgi:hypothetical protein